MISILDKMYQWWRALGMVLVLLVISLSGIAQISFKKCPLDFSLIPRERGSQKGGIEFVGHSANSAIWLSRYKNNRLELSIKLFTDSSTGVYSFQFIDSIDVGLFNYRYEFSQPSIGIVKVIDSICVGDIYIVNGQSNAESASKGEACNYLRNEFIRTYGNASETPSAKKWFWGSGDGTKDIPGHIGQLGMALAYELMAEKHIPIAIFNGGVGGKELNYFMRDELNYTNETTSYGRLLKRLIESNTVNYVKAILWYQGEKDAGIGTSYSLYSSRLQTLYNAWTEDFKGFENLYLYQIRLGVLNPNRSLE